MFCYVRSRCSKLQWPSFAAGFAGKGWAMRFISCPCRGSVDHGMPSQDADPQFFVCAFPMWFEGLRKITMPCRQLDRKPRTSFAPGFRFGSTQMISKASFRISYNNVVVCLILLFPQSHPRTLQVYANNTSVGMRQLENRTVKMQNKNDYFRGLEQSTSKSIVTTAHVGFVFLNFLTHILKN